MVVISVTIAKGVATDFMSLLLINQYFNINTLFAFVLDVIYIDFLSIRAL